MSTDIGFDTQVPSLPPGGGATAGLGETFTPDLANGTGTYKIPLDLPNGPNDIGPRLSLLYDTAAGNGPFGMGFNIPMPRLLRSTARGYPAYDSSDSLMLEGAGELLATVDGQFRPLVDGGAWRAVASDEGFQLIDREGVFYFVGVSRDSRLFDSSTGSERVYAWHLERIEDALGNTAVFTWMRDRNQLYLSRLRYGVYEVRFNYAPRPDVIRWARAGFQIVTALRCESIELHLTSAAQSLLRRWTLSYTQAAANNASQLTSVMLSGFDDDNQRLDAPALRLGYSSFQPRDLTRFSSVDESIFPGPLVQSSRRVELVDWNGDGLPDLLEVGAGGKARLWPNVGECTWGHPQTIPDLPLFASPKAAVAFADMNGDGSADLLRVDLPFTGFVPHVPGGGFDRPITWRQAPATPLASPNARLVDLDGDGLADLLVSSPEYLSLYYRTDPDGWSEQPQVIPRSTAPDVNLSDPHIFIADMTGDGTQDIVRVDGGGVTYWPHLGHGNWDQPVQMGNAPQLPFDLRAERLFLSDIDGDGCADLIYLDEGSVRYWINQGGTNFSEMRTIAFVPTGQITEVRLADMRGSGTAGLLWSSSGPFQRGSQYFYLDFTGGNKPYLLNTIENGVGLTTEVNYTTSARAAAADARAGFVWTTFLPVAISLVESMTFRDQATGRTSVTSFRYHQGRYDGLLREFAGFGRVDQEEIGDTNSPTLRTTTWFHTGIDESQTESTMQLAERRRLRAIRGRIFRQERYGLDGSAQQNAPYDRLDQRWNVETVDTLFGVIYVPRLISIVRSNFERSTAPASVITTTNIAWDTDGNVTESIQRSEAPGDASQSLTLRTVSVFATDPTSRFIAKPSRVTQFAGAGERIADTITEYDNAVEGSVGARGLVTKRSALALTDELVTTIYGAAAPDFAALGYFRRAAETGWWINQSSYERTENAAGLRGQVTGPRGGVNSFEFDENKTYPVQITDARGNVTRAEHDYRVCRIKQLTDASGAVFLAAYDSLARLRATVQPGDTTALPTMFYEYNSASVPIETRSHVRAVSGAVQTTDTRELFDGSGKLIERRITDETGEIIIASNLYDARGFLARAFLERRANAAAYAAPAGDLPHTSYTYDALGRPTSQENRDGSVRRITYTPLTSEEFDEEDTQVGGPHEATPTRRTFDPTGRVRSIQQNEGGRLLTTTYRYDEKGNLVTHTDAMGNTVQIKYDLLGHSLRIDRPEQTSISVFDAAGNAVEARSLTGTLVTREFDESNRPVAVRFNNSASPPVIRFTYHDAGFPAPPEASVNTVGRCVRIDDEGGSTILDYDQRGSLVRKRQRPAGMDRTFELNAEYRADGQLAAVTYPNGGIGPRRVTYEYDVAGRLVRVPTLINSIEYELDGKRSRVTYANGTQQTYLYQEINRRLASMELIGPTGVLHSTQLTTDQVGNLLRVDSADPALQATYGYDDLYQLSTAALGTGESWNYTYDDSGNISHKSDIGDYHYGENGAPSTCLTSAGTQSFTYGASGEMDTTPWGVQTFNPMGRLVRIEKDGGLGRTEFTYDYTGNRVAVRTSGNATPAVNRLTPDPLYTIEAGALILNLYDGQSIIGRQTEDGSTIFLHTDHAGSLVVVTDATGQPLERLRYDPYGAMLQRSGQAEDSSIGFTGGALDASTGLLYLNARYYNPALGRFISPDSVVQNALDPAAWSPFIYCRNNPTSFVDPSGHSFWGIFVASLAIVALIVVVAVCVALNVLSFGTLTPILVVAAGMVIGGIVGGLAAAAKGGSTEDIITGIFVGAAVGGWGAFGGLYVGGAVAAGMGHGFVSAVVSGAVSGTINGAAIGFAAGYAGGKGTLDEIWTKVWQGALVGMATGALLGGVSYFLKPPTTSISHDVRAEAGKWAQSTEPITPSAPATIPNAPPLAEPTSIGNVGQAVQSVGTQGLGRFGAIGAAHTLPYVIGSTVGQTVIIDMVVGAWDLGYARWIGEKIGFVKTSGTM